MMQHFQETLRIGHNSTRHFIFRACALISRHRSRLHRVLRLRSSRSAIFSFYNRCVIKSKHSAGRQQKGREACANEYNNCEDLRQVRLGLGLGDISIKKMNGSSRTIQIRVIISLLLKKKLENRKKIIM